MQVAQQAVAQPVDPAMDSEFLAALPGVAGNRRLTDVGHLLDDVQFAQAIARGELADGRHACLVLLAHVLHVPQPVVAQADAIAAQGRADAAATVVAADDDVAHAQDVDRELHDRQAIEIGVHNQVGDIAVDEQFAGQQSDDVIGGHAAVGAADPQVARRLLRGELAEELRILPANALGPAPVVVEQFAEFGHAGFASGASPGNPLSGSRAPARRA